MRPRPFELPLLLIFLLAATLARAQPLPPAVGLALQHAHIPLSGVAAYVRGVDGARPLLSHNAAAAMNPASTMKLLTTYAALEQLGPSYTWKTEAYAGGKLQDGVLQGDLILKGYGDPKLTLEQFWLLLRKLRALGLREIRGDLVQDRSYFETPAYDPGKFDAEPLRAYNVGPDALLLNFKAVRFQFHPDADTGIVTVIAEPRPAGLEFAAAVRATGGACGDWRAGIKADFQNKGATAKASFSGSMPASCGEHYWNASLLAQPDYVYGVFRQLWEELGGSIKGGWRDGVVPADAKLLATGESASSAELVRDINKFSNNVMARQLFLTLGAEMLALPGNSARSGQAVRSWLAEKKLDFPELVLENGSGLSREERISAEHMGSLLLEAWRSAVMPELMSSLPLVAHDGTMRRRLRSEAIAGQAHIKTGSLADARTLAGYVLDKHGRRLVVVLFINHPNAGAGQPAQDALLQWVYEGGAGRGN
ncbi:MAG: D-alanyl-D-alanine carboxypeptidase/D-alanyl-D-alanine-endopeptidase [Burkholderiales bacterium]|nr:D-alanyl-D-alanine carboxypeptidase/D-alanyl-D-alanine-endopeptidase [Burkholderiales bacterium]